MSNERYTITVSGERLIFTNDQIRSDPGNYFETYFFGNFAGSRGARELIVEKDVQLFKLIQAHLRGYEILPLAADAIPSYMSKEVALTNLLREAQFYRLQMLVGSIQQFRANCTVSKRVPSKYKLEIYTVKLGWRSQDITEEMYRFHLNRFSQMPRACLSAMDFYSQPGYSVQISWQEFLSDDAKNGLVCECALLALND